jgi:hypothetical protein
MPQHGMFIDFMSVSHGDLIRFRHSMVSSIPAVKGRPKKIDQVKAGALRCHI